jgi:hypothetical protein
MPSSKKGRISGGKRQEINQQRALAALSGKTEGILFGRVTKFQGNGHISVAIPYAHGSKELRVRIPNVLGRRGATPINTSSVVSIYVGSDYDPNKPENKNDHFDVTAILTAKQAHQLFKDGILPEWMIADIETDKTETKTGAAGGYEFDYSDDPETNESDKEKEPSVTGDRLAQRKEVDTIDNSFIDTI